MMATGAALDTKPFSTAFIVTSVPELGAMTLPWESTFSSTVANCSTLDFALCIPASSWERVEFRVATAVCSCNSAWSISICDAAPIANNSFRSCTVFSKRAICISNTADWS